MKDPENGPGPVKQVYDQHRLSFEIIFQAFFSNRSLRFNLIHLVTHVRATKKLS